MESATLVNIFDEEEVYPLREGKNIVGRSINKKNDVSIPARYTRVSKKHCEIDWINGALVVKNTDSTHGTYVNGNLIEEKILKNKDKLGLGLHYVFEVRIEGADLKLAK